MSVPIHRAPVPALLLGAALLFLSPVPSRSQSKPGLTPDPKIISFTLPDKIQWEKGENADTAILQGDPSKPGLYIQLIRWHPGNMSRPHTHPNDRYIYVVSGTWYMGWGSTFAPENTFGVKAGTYVVHHANELHYDGARDQECVLYIVGMGPVNTPQVGSTK